MTKTLIPKHYSPTREEVLKALGAVSETEYNKMWRSLDEKTKEINALVQKIHILEERLEVSEKEHYRTLEQLRIATKALKDYANSDEWELVDSKSVYWSRKRFPYPWRIAGKALKEMEGVK